MSKKEMTARERAESRVLRDMEMIEMHRKEKGVSMRALAAAAGLRPTSYWGIVRSKEKMRGVKAVTLEALAIALHGF